MEAYISSEPTRDTITVASWNILLDKTREKQGLVRPQAKRLGSHIETLAKLGKRLDAVTLMEVQETESQHHGEVIARALGYEASFWCNHNTSKRLGEYIGMFGNRVEAVDFVDLPHDKSAVVTQIGGTAIVGLHLRNEKWGPMRADQTAALLEYAGDTPRVVLAGDFNALPLTHSRDMLRRAGFRSVYNELGERRPKTFVTTEEYRQAMVRPPLRRLIPRGISLDDIYVREGMEVVDAGTFSGDSDHLGLWAEIVL